ncbi:hypothetical protein MTBLM1_80037 [Rhodospirillaceae bacterium LM-1]|nr:hypothetical protein MTBLM1_80037 [Rhodospirillaceae bacterium LM-1]
MTKTNDTDENKVIATFQFNGNIMFSALQSFLQVLADAGVDSKSDSAKYTVLGYLVEAMAVVTATTTDVSEGEDIAYILAGHTAKRTVERLHERWLYELKQEASERNMPQPIDLTEIEPQGEA